MIKWLYNKYLIWRIKRNLLKGILYEPITNEMLNEFQEITKRALANILKAKYIPAYKIEPEYVSDTDKTMGIVKFKITFPSYWLKDKRDSEF
jgi:hypothetical protein